MEMMKKERGSGMTWIKFRIEYVIGIGCVR